MKGHLVVFLDGTRFSWRISIGINSRRTDAYMESAWKYMSTASAKAAAIRWAKRFNIELIA